MAITNDERREVAENLRTMTMRGCRYKEEFYDLLNETVMNEWDFHSFSDVAERLADLIEPEERTCRNVSKSTYSDEFNCSECGLSLDLIGSECGCGSTMAFFKGRKMVRELKEPNYCPNCGAKVVE